jgi:hypothetical protein
MLQDYWSSRIWTFLTWNQRPAMVPCKHPKTTPVTFVQIHENSHDFAQVAHPAQGSGPWQMYSHSISYVRTRFKPLRTLTMVNSIVHITVDRD